MKFVAQMGRNPVQVSVQSTFQTYMANEKKCLFCAKRLEIEEILCSKSYHLRYFPKFLLHVFLTMTVEVLMFPT